MYSNTHEKRLEQDMSLNAKEAIRRAFEIARDYENFLCPDRGFKNLRLEAVEFTEDLNEWHITLGFDTGKVKTTQTSGPAVLDTRTTREEERDFKTIVLDSGGNFKKIEMQ